MFLIDFPSIAFTGSSISFIEEDDEEFYGIIVGIDTVPGSSHPVWNLCVTATHSAGHWFGLGHTQFTRAGDCEPNWLKRDGQSNELCGARCDANIMSYGADACLTEFTAEKITAVRDNAIKVLGI
ncbi:Pregnancy-associated plasma protein-A [Beauveria brongniartii RCEF 3172]|uniref:Pregnancy-associated plasma protein-A n=1 Tax=Beauveria brongniartii RCEF 3172 TaxID=1081107 RepID=A0A162M5G6_9HYPO|nr:Pregnancy-associated plasma protein-A [Beauveria brongniartii RCEF 3172]